MLLNSNRAKEPSLGSAVRLVMKVVRILALIALIAIPSSSYAWSRGRAVIVRPGFSSGVVVARPAFPVVRGVVVNPYFFPRPYYFPAPYTYYYPPTQVYSYS